MYVITCRSCGAARNVMDAARDIVASHGFGNVATFQRLLRVSWAEALALVGALEAEGRLIRPDSQFSWVAPSTVAIDGRPVRS